MCELVDEMLDSVPNSSKSKPSHSSIDLWDGRTLLLQTIAAGEPDVSSREDVCVCRFMVLRSI